MVMIDEKDSDAVSGPVCRGNVRSHLEVSYFECDILGKGGNYRCDMDSKEMFRRMGSGERL
jgi:hypothetical protein